MLKSRLLILSLFGLIVINVVAYAPIRHYGFVNYDDPQYVSNNPNVNSGLTAHGLVWAFNAGYQANWHPLTWLSHMLDVQLYGLNAGPHHLTNLFFHVANTLLLFWFFLDATGALGASAFVAAMFAVHPLHVESVAWIAERKDVLSTFFGLLVLCGYVRYVRAPSQLRYVILSVLFVLSLMSKPMLVSLPFVLLLVDFWPLGRVRFGKRSNVAELIREKIPFFALCAVSGVLTIIAQRTGGAMAELEAIPFGTRVANASTAYFEYLRKTIWPADLTILYPLSGTPSPLWVFAALILVVVSVVCVRAGRHRAYIPVGWFWYLGTLIPVIGIIQVGRQSIADRYTYFPLIGIFLLIAFFANEIAQSRRSQIALAAVSGLLVLVCVALTRAQVGYWSSNTKLWEHTIEVAPDNAMARLALAGAFDAEGQPDKAIAQYSEALRVEPEFAAAEFNLGALYIKQSKADEAIKHFEAALRLTNAPGPLIDQGQIATAHHYIGIDLMNKGRIDDAAEHFEKALQLDPNLPEAENGLGIRDLLHGKLEDAAKRFAQAVHLKPDYAVAHNNLGTVLGNLGRNDDAVAEYKEAIRIYPDYAEAHRNVGILLAKQGNKDEAVSHLSEALRLNPGDQVARTALANLTK